MFETILDAREVSVGYPDKFEHLWIEGKSLGVSCIAILQTFVHPVLTKVHDCGKFLFK